MEFNFDNDNNELTNMFDSSSSDNASLTKYFEDLIIEIQSDCNLPTVRKRLKLKYYNKLIKQIQNNEQL